MNYTTLNIKNRVDLYLMLCNYINLIFLLSKTLINYYFLNNSITSYFAKLKFLVDTLSADGKSAGNSI
ncbi:hypothetical protein SAMN04489722_105288 [Algibacter lectus]|nr:hypothetical protein SAMN04489722_105288 [Algibacter lectus]